MPFRDFKLHWFALILLATAVCVSGCGSERSSVAAKVGQTAIKKTTVEHWMDLIDAGATTGPGQQEPKAPRPPSFSACIGYHKRYDTKHGASAARLKQQCEYEYEKLKLKALYKLICAAWAEEDAARLNITVKPSELALRLASLKRELGGDAAFRQLLTSRRASVADILLGDKEALLLEKIQQRLEHSNESRHLSKAQRQAVLKDYGATQVRLWRARTDCQRGYVVPLCKQFHASKVPFGIVPPAIPLTELVAG